MELNECPKCHSRDIIKSGLIRGKQRYMCKECGRQFTIGKLKSGYDETVRKQAMKLYMEGMGFRGIERVMQISHNTVANWVKEAGKKRES